MSSIHLIGSIIDQLKLRASEFEVAKPTDKQKFALEMQWNIIRQLSDVYSQYDKLTLWDIFCTIQSEHDRLIALDKELDGLIVSIPFKENADTRKYGYINLQL